MLYKIRFDTHDQELIDRLCSGHSRYLYSLEYSKKGRNKAHTHFFLESERKRDTLVKIITKHPEYVKGRQWYYVKLCKVSEKMPLTRYLGYCMKDSKYYSKGITDAELLEGTKYDERVKADIKEKKEKKKSRYKRITEGFEAQGCFDGGDAIKFVYDFFKKEKCNVSINTVASWSNTLYMQYSPGHFNNVEKRVLEMLYGRS